MRPITKLAVAVFSMAIFSGCATRTANSVDSVQRAGVAYSECSGDKERLQCCIDLINSHLIRFNSRKKDIAEIFGADFVDLGVRDGHGLAFVYFHPRHPSLVADGQSAILGWYLQLDYSESGFIKEYSLSNFHMK